MTDINCSSNCVYKENGKCVLTQIKSVSKVPIKADCAYFIPEAPTKKTPHKFL